MTPDDAKRELRLAARPDEIALWKWAASRKRGRTFDAFVLECLRAGVSREAVEFSKTGRLPQFVADWLQQEAKAQDKR